MNIVGLSIERANKKARVTELDGVRLTPAQQLAYMQAEHAADQIMEAIRWAKNLAWLVLIFVMTISYEDQERYLRRIGMSHIASILIPFVFDAATVLCVKVIGTYAMKRIAKVVSLVIILFPVCASAFINVQASPTAKVAIIYVMVVALIPAIELIRALIGADYDKMRGVEINLLSSVKANVISDAEQARRAEHGRKISEGRLRNKEKREQEAAEAAEALRLQREEDERAEKERREANQLRGMLAAETRKKNAEEAKAAEEAARVLRPSRSRKAKHPVQEIQDLEGVAPISVPV